MSRDNEVLNALTAPSGKAGAGRSLCHSPPRMDAAGDAATFLYALCVQSLTGKTHFAWSPMA